MKTLLVIPTIILCSFLLSCKSGSTREAVADSTRVENNISDKTISLSAAVVSNSDSTRKFIRTADLKFKVKNVVSSTYDIEDITRKNGGFVTYTNLASTIDNTSNTQVSEDSSLETTFYNITNSITIKIPNTKLDTTLKEIARNIDYLDYRIIKAEDVALQILANNLAQKRGESNEQRLTDALDTKGKKLAETTSAEELLLKKREEADNAKLANLSLIDQVKLSTITIYLYQKQTVKREMVANYKSIKEYEPSFGRKIIESFFVGWDVLESIIVSLIKLWGLFVLGLMAYLLYRKYGGWLKKK